MADDNSSVLSGGAQGAAAGAAFGPWGVAIGAGVGMLGGYLSGQSAKSAAKAQAAALQRRASEIRRRGEINANQILQQGDLDQAGYAANRGSAGFAFSITDMDSLNVLKDRAAQQAQNIRDEAAFEAQASIDEAGQYKAKADSQDMETVLGMGSTALNAYNKYKGN